MQSAKPISNYKRKLDAEQEKELERKNRLKKISEELEAIRLAVRLRRRAEREEYYRERGVKPGPWAWFQVLPEWLQAILLGLAISVPVIVGAIIYTSTL